MRSLPVLVLSSSLRGHNELLAEQVLGEWGEKTGVELRPSPPEKVQEEPLPLLFHLTGGTEHLAWEFAEKVRAPLVLLAHRSHNSLPAALETLARLSSEGLPSGCEGDLPALLVVWMSQILTGLPGFLANPVEVDLKRERLLLAHCTVPFSLVENFQLRPHFESGLGLAVAGKVRPGPYTLLRLGGRRLEKAFVVEGTVLAEVPGREDLCRTQVWFKMPKGALEKLLREPLGNHHVLIPGHHRQVLELFYRAFLAD